MGLDSYHQKRDFDKTSEPEGDLDSKDAVAGHRFVVQKHDARSLHYDLRLEEDGVLKSWAVPKGPTTDPSSKRLAIQTEDHPLEYLLFEGVIPQGEYGGGTVMVWDTGTWDSVKGSLASGKLTFVLTGKKLSGTWQIIRTNRRVSDKNHWLLSKLEDAHSSTSDDECLLASKPLSILTNRSLTEIAADGDNVWTGSNSGQTSGSGEGRFTEMQSKIRDFLRGLSNEASAPTPDFSQIVASTDGARPSELPKSSLRPALPTAVRQAPDGEQWVHEIKYDGYRMLCHIDGGAARMISRNGKDWTDKLPRLAGYAGELPVRNCILDGEVAALTDDGRTDFQELQSLIGNGDDRLLRYFVFDLIHLDGFDLTGATLLDRKKILRSVLPNEHPAFQYSEHITGQGEVVFNQASKLGTEGIVSKRADSRYVFGRTEQWLKIKCLSSAEFVVGGYTVSDTAHRTIRALVLGRYGEQGELCYEGRVGTGFTTKTLDDLEKQLTAIQVEESPFSNLDDSAGREYRWVKPDLVVEVEYGGWTRDGVLRFPSYRGQRNEFDPLTIVQGPSESSDDVPSATVAPPFEVDLDSLSGFRLTHPERIVYPKDGVTKLGLATYYGRVAGWMLPHLIGRPLALVRCPKGVDSRCFFQKKPIKGMPASIHSPEVAAEGRTTQNPPVVLDLEGLMALIQFGTLEIHTWGCLADRPDRPDAITFDLDPDAALPFQRVVDAALMLREHLSDLNLKGFVKTTGGKGLHVIVPIRRRSSWTDVESFCDAVSQKMLRHSPSRFTTSPSKAARKGKIYLDTLRNRFGATSIAPFSTRSKDRATVSMPLGWDELSGLVSANGFAIDNVFGRLDHLTSDPWRDFGDQFQGLSKTLLKKLPNWAKTD